LFERVLAMALEHLGNFRISQGRASMRWLCWRGAGRGQLGLLEDLQKPLPLAVGRDADEHLVAVGG